MGSDDVIEYGTNMPDPGSQIDAVDHTIIEPENRAEKLKIYDSIEEFERNLPSTVTVLKTPTGNKVYLVGTAHFSLESCDDVSLVFTLNY